MRQPLIMHQGGPEHLEHMIARLDVIEDELVSFKRVLKSQDGNAISFRWSQRDEAVDNIDKAATSVRMARAYAKDLRQRVRAQRPR